VLPEIPTEAFEIDFSEGGPIETQPHPAEEVVTIQKQESASFTTPSAPNVHQNLGGQSAMYTMDEQFVFEDENGHPYAMGYFPI